MQPLLYASIFAAFGMLAVDCQTSPDKTAIEKWRKRPCGVHKVVCKGKSAWCIIGAHSQEYCDCDDESEHYDQNKESCVRKPDWCESTRDCRKSRGRGHVCCRQFWCDVSAANSCMPRKECRGVGCGGPAIILKRKRPNNKTT